MPEPTAPPSLLVLRPYQWSIHFAVIKVLLYPILIGVLGSLLAVMTGSSGLLFIFLAVIPLVTAAVAGITGLMVAANRSTVVTADATSVTRRWMGRTTSCPRSELAEIQYGSPLRGAVECRFVRRDGRTAFHITLAPWAALQHDLKGFAAALGLPLRPHPYVRRFTL
ncbi:MAG TPA: hypothetical protein VET65_06350 [Candidatus Limnocylindrales bacterium]|nr:hypothetical protein [Candidatus Limnocylindrales bacterium]